MRPSSEARVRTPTRALTARRACRHRDTPPGEPSAHARHSATARKAAVVSVALGLSMVCSPAAAAAPARASPPRCRRATPPAPPGSGTGLPAPDRNAHPRPCGPAAVAGGHDRVPARACACASAHRVGPTHGGDLSSVGCEQSPAPDHLVAVQRGADAGPDPGRPRPLDGVVHGSLNSVDDDGDTPDLRRREGTGTRPGVGRRRRELHLHPGRSRPPRRDRHLRRHRQRCRQRSPSARAAGPAQPADLRPDRHCRPPTTRTVSVITSPGADPSAYVVPLAPDVLVRSVLTVGESPSGSDYPMVGAPDGLGCWTTTTAPSRC